MTLFWLPKSLAAEITPDPAGSRLISPGSAASPARGARSPRPARAPRPTSGSRGAADPLGPHAGQLVRELDVLDQLLVHIEMQQRHEPAIERPASSIRPARVSSNRRTRLGREAVDQAGDPADGTAQHVLEDRSSTPQNIRKRSPSTFQLSVMRRLSCEDSLIATMFSDSASPRKPSRLEVDLVAPRGCCRS